MDVNELVKKLPKHFGIAGDFDNETWVKLSDVERALNESNIDKTKPSPYDLARRGATWRDYGS